MNLRRIVAGALVPGNPARRLLAAAVSRVVVPLTGGPPPGLRRGRDVPRREAPVVLVEVDSTDGAALDALLTELAAAVADDGTPTPVLVLDHAWWPAVRRAGFALEQRFADPRRQARHLDELRRTYGTDAVVVVDPSAIDVTVTRVLEAPVRPLSRVRAPFRRLEGWADRRPS